MQILRRLRDRVNPHGTLDVYVYSHSEDAPPLLVTQWRQHNLVTLSGRNLIRDLMACQPGVTGLSYYAVGTSNTAASFADVALGTEVYRDTIIKFERENGLLKTYFYLPTTAANGVTLCEVGEFGDDASSTVDSGTLYARTVLAQSIAKTIDISVTFIHSNLWEAV